MQRENQIGDAGACGIGDGLKQNSSVQELLLVRCMFLIVCFVVGSGYIV